MNRPAIYLNGKRWIDCPEPLSYAAADHATNAGYKPGTPEWWAAFRQYRKDWREKHA